jgi:hypothetical protein
MRVSTLAIGVPVYARSVDSSAQEFANHTISEQTLRICDAHHSFGKFDGVNDSLDGELSGAYKFFGIKFPSR